MTTKDEKDTKAPAKRESTSGADDALIAKGEMTGVARGPDVDSSFHVYEFDEPNQGEGGEIKQDTGKPVK